MKYYYLSWDNRGNATIAKAPPGTLGIELAPKLQDRNELPFELLVDKGELLDYQPNTIAWPLMSDKLKNILTYYLTGSESLSWVNARVVTGDKSVNYYIPRFDKSLDVLDTTKTIFAGNNFVVKACISIEKASRYSYFSLPDLPFTSRIIVSEKIKDCVTLNNLTGMRFELVAAR